MKMRLLIPGSLLALLLGPSMACLADSSLQSKPDITQLALETKEPVRFAIDPQRVVDLKGKEGTVLRFKPGSLVLKDGSAPTAKRVEVRLWEIYSCFDVLNAGLVTQSGKRILETAGMIYVEADSDGQPLRLAEGTSMLSSVSGEPPIEARSISNTVCVATVACCASTAAYSSSILWR